MRRLIFSVIAVVSTATPALAANPLGSFFDTYKDRTAAINSFPPYMHPTAMLVTGNCNLDDPYFQQARAAGAEVLAYIDPIERHDFKADGSNGDPCAAYTQRYTLDDGTPAPLWPFNSPGSWPHPSSTARVNFANTHMLDIQAGSSWSNRVVAYVEDLMRSGTVDGVFVDVAGARLWSTLASWNSWDLSERQAWTQGNIDLVRRLDASRRSIDPRFIIVNNNIWDSTDTQNDGFEGEHYVDGVVLQNPQHDTYHIEYAHKTTFAPSGHRRMLVLTNSDQEAALWANDDLVTHVGNQTGDHDTGWPPGYAYPPPPAPSTPTTRLPDRPKSFGRRTVAATPSSGMAADRKRASKFNIPDTGHLTALDAYLDGLGGATGTQSVRLDLYSDNNGQPGAKVAESSTRTFSAGAAGAWRGFNIPENPLLTPGDYWIAIHTGPTVGVLRNFGDGTGNWYSNDDVFADGASATFGSGTTGSVTLSVQGQYLVGQ